MNDLIQQTVAYLVNLSNLTQPIVIYDVQTANFINSRPFRIIS